MRPERDPRALNAMKPSLVLVTLLLSACSDVAAASTPVVSTSAAAEPAQSGVLAIRVTGFRSDEGKALISVYRGEDGFPGKPARAWKNLTIKISGGRASIDVRDIPPGEYAIAVAHDENSNNTLDTSWIGIPREGVGMSNNAKGRMGPPKYRDAKFTVTPAGATQAISLVYL